VSDSFSGILSPDRMRAISRSVVDDVEHFGPPKYPARPTTLPPDAMLAELFEHAPAPKSVGAQALETLSAWRNAVWVQETTCEKRILSLFWAWDLVDDEDRDVLARGLARHGIEVPPLPALDEQKRIARGASKRFDLLSQRLREGSR